VIRNSRFHRGSHTERLVDAPTVVVHEVDRDGRRVILDLLLKALVSRVNRRMDIRIVRFWRST
jgi:hypothetical protein